MIDGQDKGQDVILYEGDGAASNPITGLNFQPDFVWIKNRQTTDHHQWFDSVRGVTKPCRMNDSTVAEAVNADTLLSFDSAGFTVGADVWVNTNLEDYAAFCHKKGAAWGFDIQTFTGTGSAHAESHDLGAVPEFIIVWNRTQGRSAPVYHHHAITLTDPETDYQFMDTAAAWVDAATVWNDTAPTSTQFTVGTSANVNESGESMVAWLWRGIDGFSKAGSWVGNGNANGPYVHCGFRPRCIWFKNAQGANSWRWYDVVRNAENQGAVNNGTPLRYILHDSNNAEADETAESIIWMSNGFKINASTAYLNTNLDQFVYFAWAESPWKYANAY
jgi:hypothetical protein